MANTYLPGIAVTLNDLGLKVAPPPSGPKVTLLGITSNTGITLREPFVVSSVEKAINSLYFHTGHPTSGRFPGELSLAVEEASRAGAQNIEVMVIGHYTGTELLSYISPTGVKTGRYTDLSGAYDVLRNRDLDIVTPVGAFMDQDIDTNDNKSFGKQLADFCFQATQESNAAVGVIPVMPILHWAYANRATLQVDNNSYTGLGGGIPGIDPGNTPPSVFSGELVSLFGPSSANPSVINNGLLFGVPSVSLLGEWVRYHTARPSGEFQSRVHGPLISGSTTVVDGGYTAHYLAWLRGAQDQNGNSLADAVTSSNQHPSYFVFWQATDSDGNPAVDSRSVKVDAGGFFNVFSTPVTVESTQARQVANSVNGDRSRTSYNTSGAPSYAGLVVSLAPHSATTNKFVPGLNSLKLISASQANKLVGYRHVTMYARSKGFVVASGVTGAYNVNSFVRSDYVRLTTVRIAHAAVDLIRAVGDKYIGEPNNAPQLNALNAEVDQALLSMKSSGAITAYDFTISSTPDQRVLGQLDINLTLVPAFEIIKINLVVSLAAQL